MKAYKSLVLFVLLISLIGCTNTNSQESGKQGSVEKLTTAEFQSKVFDFKVNKEWKFAGKLPCIVDFYADWCRPCKIIAPYLDELAVQYKGKINVYKVNIDHEKELAGAFGISGIPAVLFCPIDGKPNMSTGAQQKAEYERMIKEILLKEKK